MSFRLSNFSRRSSSVGGNRWRASSLSRTASSNVIPGLTRSLNQAWRCLPISVGGTYSVFIIFTAPSARHSCSSKSRTAQAPSGAAYSVSVPTMPLLTELEKFCLLGLQRFRAYGAAKRFLHSSFCLHPFRHNGFWWALACAAAMKPLNSGCGWCGLLKNSG